jgi:hypothetical protein
LKSADDAIELGAARGPGSREVRRASQNVPVDLGRISWLVTVGACLIAAVILTLQGYLGYAGVTFAVAVSAAINLS